MTTLAIRGAWFKRLETFDKQKILQAQTHITKSQVAVVT